MKGTVLLVEDEKINMAMLEKIVQEAGFDTTKAEDGQQAWNILQEKEFDVIITDRLMPNMDGLELFMNIKGDDRLKDIPVIMQTAADKPEDISEGIDAGIYYYLTKPYDRNTLVCILNAAFEEFSKKNRVKSFLEKNKLAVSNMRSAVFYFRGIKEAENIALLVGSIAEDNVNVTTGLYELMINAIEHGNLAIALEKKAELISTGNYQDELEKMCNLDENKSKYATLEVDNSGAELSFFIKDMGKGFDATPYMQLEPSRATDFNGRGIAKANLLAFDEMEYKGSGNEIECKIFQAA